MILSRILSVLAFAAFVGICYAQDINHGQDRNLEELIKTYEQKSELRKSNISNFTVSEL